MLMTRQFERNIDSLEEIHRFIHELARDYHLDDKIVFITDLVVEELFVNAVKYNPGNTNAISLSIFKDAEKLQITMVDYDVDPFDLRQTAKFDPTKTLEERRIGGLGIPLIKRMMDKVDYEYKDRQSKITLSKYLENNHVQDKDR